MTVAGDGPEPAEWSRPAGRPGTLAVAVLVGVLVIVGVLTWASSLVYQHTEGRLLDLKAREVASVISASVPSVQTPLQSAAALADATGGDPTQFRLFMAPYVGTGRIFASASLRLLSNPEAGPIVSVGASPMLAGASAAGRAFFAEANRTSTLDVTGELGGAHPFLAYEDRSNQTSSRYAVYAEHVLPADRHLAIASNSAFADLNGAVYLGRVASASALIGTSTRGPIGGRHATQVVPFGNNELTLVVAPKGPLSGDLSERLPWIVAIGGTLLAVGLAALTDRLVRRRTRAEELVAQLDAAVEENRLLYTEQRTIAQTLQHALLPTALPALRGTDVSSRYVPGEKGIDVGGDWFDLIPLDGDRALFVVGDVSGRGLRAAVVMASLRYAIRAYAMDGDPPAAILSKLSSIASLTRDGRFATVICALLDVPRHELTVANAGHLPPLVANGTRWHYVDTDVGLPVGVTASPAYGSVTVQLAPGATVLAFTDGLVERRGETLDAGLERLRQAIGATTGSLDNVIASVLDELTRDGPVDDTAILGVR